MREPNWETYYQAVADRPPRDTLLKALANFAAESQTDQIHWAVDLGCGEGRDTVELLHQGWQVLAIDGEQQGLDRLLQRPDLPLNRLQTQRMRFESLTLPAEVDLNQCQFLPAILSTCRLSGSLANHRDGTETRWAVLWAVVWRSRFLGSLP